MTREQKNIRRLKDSYTVVDGCKGSWRTAFQVGVQKFYVGPSYSNKKEAEWFAKMLAIALDQLLQIEAKEP